MGFFDGLQTNTTPSKAAPTKKAPAKTPTAGKGFFSGLSYSPEDQTAINAQVPYSAPEPAAPVEMVTKPKKNFGEKIKSFTDNFSTGLGEFGSQMNAGIVRTLGNIAQNVQDTDRLLQNSLGRGIDKFMGIDTQRKPTENVDQYLNRLADKFSSVVPPEDKKFIDHVAEGFGSSIPFIAGGFAAKAAQVPVLLANLGFSGTEALVNARDDFNSLIEKGDDIGTARAKALGSFGANLGANFLMNKLGGFFEATPDGLWGATKKFLTTTLFETGQEVTQQAISNVSTGNEITTGLTETGLVSLPISAIFGAAGVMNFQEPGQKQLREYLKESAQTGATRDEIVSMMTEATGLPPEQVSSVIDQHLAADSSLDREFNQNEEDQKLPYVQKASDMLANGSSPNQAILTLTQEIGIDEATAIVQQAQENPIQPVSQETPTETDVAQPSAPVTRVTSESSPVQIQDYFSQRQDGFDTDIKDVKEAITRLETEIKDSPKNSRIKKEKKLLLQEKRTELKNREAAFDEEMRGTIQSVRKMVENYAARNHDIRGLTKQQLKNLTQEVMSFATDPSLRTTFTKTPLRQIVRGVFNDFAEANGGKGKERVKRPKKAKSDSKKQKTDQKKKKVDAKKPGKNKRKKEARKAKKSEKVSKNKRKKEARKTAASKQTEKRKKVEPVLKSAKSENDFIRTLKMNERFNKKNAKKIKEGKVEAKVTFADIADFDAPAFKIKVPDDVYDGVAESVVSKMHPEDITFLKQIIDVNRSGGEMSPAYEKIMSDVLSQFGISEDQNRTKIADQVEAVLKGETKIPKAFDKNVSYVQNPKTGKFEGSAAFKTGIPKEQGKRKNIPEITAIKKLQGYNDRLGTNIDMVFFRAIFDNSGKPAIGVAFDNTVGLETIEQKVDEYAVDHEITHVIESNIEKIPLFKGITRQQLFDELRRKNPNLNSEENLREELAEGFEVYVQEQEAKKPTTFKGRLRLFYSKIYNQLKNIFTAAKNGNLGKVQDFYNKLYYGTASEQANLESEGVLRRTNGTIDFSKSRGSQVFKRSQKSLETKARDFYRKYAKEGLPSATKSTRVVTKNSSQNQIEKKPVAAPGEIMKSKAFSRVAAQLGEYLSGDVIYNKMNIANDAAKAIEFVEKFPKEAKKISLGMMGAPEGVTETAISIALSEKAAEQKDYELQAQLERSRSLRQTRRGQEIVAERGRFNENSPQYFMKQVLQARFENLGKTKFKFGLKKTDGDGKRANANAKIDEATESLKKTVKKKLNRVELAQNIIDSITC